MNRKSRNRVLALTLIAVAGADHTAGAQISPSPGGYPPPASPAASVPAPPGAQAGLPATCVPACRSGFVCHSGQCISACNPPCPAGYACGVGGECVAAGPGPTPGATYGGQASVHYGPGAVPLGPPGGQGRRHVSFYLRLAGGFGGAAASQTDALDDTLTLSGATGFFSFDIGGAVAPDVLLHGHLAGFALAEPWSSGDAVRSTRVEGAEFSFFMMGVGVTYFVTRQEVFLSANLGLASARFIQSGVDLGEFRWGMGANFDVGKHWWVSPDWSIGVAGTLIVLTVPERVSGQDLDWSTLGLGVMFSASFG